MKRLPHLFVILFLWFYSVIALASASVPIRLEHVSINTQDRASLIRGAKFFASNCMACHSLKYLEHNKLAAKAGITLDKMPLKIKEWWLGVVPPDLTLITTLHSPDWVFTYLHSFYQDPSRPTGYNNLLVKDVNMMNVLAGMQGQQVLTKRGKFILAHPEYKKVPYYSMLRLEQAGSMTPEQFNKTITDLVNFLVYANEPAKLQREKMGWWVLLFLAAFFVLAWLLKKSYWKDVK